MHSVIVEPAHFSQVLPGKLLTTVVAVFL